MTNPNPVRPDPKAMTTQERSVKTTKGIKKVGRWKSAISAALRKRAISRGTSVDVELEKLAEALLCAVDEGDVSAIKELADRLDGKAIQMISSDPENPVSGIVVSFR